jgi:DNA-binding XRE family transcriptional regulator
MAGASRRALIARHFRWRRTQISLLATGTYSWVMSEISRIFPLESQALEPLWREVLGSRLRALRADRGETLTQTAERAGISPQYLSEVERGRKEPSSEMIAALAGALDLTVADLMAGAAEDLRQFADTFASVTKLTTSTTVTRPSGPVALAMAA